MDSKGPDYSAGYSPGYSEWNKNRASTAAAQAGTNSKDSVLQQIREFNGRKIKVAIADVDGVLRGKYLNKEKFLSAAESGFGFCNVVFGWDLNDVCYDNSDYTGWNTGYPDAIARPDLSTFRRIPWENNLPFFLADFEDETGKGLAICPRQVLKRVVGQLETAGYKALCGTEFEWFNFKETPQSIAQKNYIQPEPITPGMFGYSVLRSSLNQPFLNAIIEELGDFGIPIEGLHTETGPGVLEAALLYSSPLEAADRAVLFKTSVKEIGYRFGIMPSFMAKWNSQLPGCSGHIHQSLWSLAGDKNLFYESSDPIKMSPLYKSYLAGQLRCLPEILPLFAPNVNSYKRLTEGYWAPTKANWGVDNRTAALRVIRGGIKSTRLETRVPGSDVNPYLAIAACIASGLYGIRKNLKLEEQTALNSEGALPQNLYEAATRMARSEIAQEIFGEVFVNHFVKTRLWEWKQFQQSVTQWELQRYFEII